MKKNFFFGLFLIAVSHLQAQVNFQTLAWNETKQQAATAHKYIFMDCFTDWCSWCKVMDKEVFPDAKVAAMLNGNFIAVRSDMETGEGILLGLKYRVSGYPTYLIFNEQGKLVYTIVGYRTADKFLALLRESIDPAKQTNYKGISSDLNLPYPDFCLKFIDGKYRHQPDSNVVKTYLDQHTDWFSEVNWTIISMFVSSRSKYAQYLFDNQEKFSELYGQKEVENVIENWLGRRLTKAIMDKSEEQLDELTELADKHLTSEVKETESFYRIRFYQAIADYPKMMTELDEYSRIDNYSSVNVYNSSCWEIYEKCDDAQLVSRAVSHMEKAVLVEKGYAEMDTYASLLYKDKQFDEAEKIANNAINIGKEKGEDVSGTEALLEKIKKAKEVNN